MFCAMEILGAGDRSANRKQAQESENLKIGLTKRAPDVWDSAAFSGIFLASSFSCSQTESTPAPAQVTQTVSPLLATEII
jgi:hypothetical protein